MSAYLDKLDLICNWKCGGLRSIKDAITFGSNGDGGAKSELSDLVSLETCVQLNSPDSSSSAPELSFTFPPDVAITALKVISEARIIEIYGKGGEYLSTTHSDFLDDFEGMAVYSAYVKLAIPSPECSIKLKKLRNQDSIWLYGLGIDVQTCNSLSPESPQVDFKSVNDRLQQSGCDLTGNAEQCWRLLNTFQTFSNSPNGNASGGHKPQSFGSMETYKKMCDLLLGVSPKLSGVRSSTQGSSSVPTSPPSVHNLTVPDKPETQCSVPNVSSLNNEMKALITEQFQQLENRLMVKVDERLKKIEEKLDMMMLTFRTQTVNLESKV